MKNVKNTILSLCAILLAVGGSVYAAEPVNKTWLGSVAINKKDTVVYHSLEKHAVAQEGNSKFVVKYKGANWRFSSAAHAKQFKDSPASFAPQYNGFCANALSLGEGLIKTDGSQWWVEGKKLYLFYAKSGKTRWQNGDWQAYKVQADAAWAGLKNK